METKVCTKCKSELQISMFRTRIDRGGKPRSACKKCEYEQCAPYREMNREKIREKNYAYKNSTRGKQTSAAHRMTYNTGEEKKKSDRAAAIKYRAKNKHRVSASNTLIKSVMRGDIVRPALCQECGKQAPLDGHHDDYNKPLEVRWLCRSCHKALHKMLLLAV